MATKGQELRQELERSLDELYAMRDEIRLKIHLASMDAKDAWKQLEPNVERAEREMVEATRRFRDAVSELKTAFAALRERLP